jgi:transposase
MWKQRQLVSRRLLAYDRTNFYTYIASTNTRNQLAQRGHNKQGRHNLRQVGLSYVLDGENGLSLCHHVYPGNLADVEEFSTALGRITRMLDENQIERDSVTLVMDKGSAARANTVALEEARLGWISALPWNQTPEGLRSRTIEQLPPCSSAQPGVRAVAETTLVHGRQYLCVLKYSASFASEQMHSLTTSLSRVMQSLRRLSRDVNKPGAHWNRNKILHKIQRWLSGPYLDELVRYQLEESQTG